MLIVVVVGMRIESRAIMGYLYLWMRPMRPVSLPSVSVFSEEFGRRVLLTRVRQSTKDIITDVLLAIVLPWMCWEGVNTKG